MYVLGVAVLFVCSIPWMLDRGAGLPGLVVAMIVISLALGGVKASLPPLLGVCPINVHVNFKFR
jgi:POT family proton-dependent oligopeptide transporter